jgi:hypothetical protein
MRRCVLFHASIDTAYTPVAGLQNECHSVSSVRFENRISAIKQRMHAFKLHGKSDGLTIDHAK